jgi:hypothetical protein
MKYLPARVSRFRLLWEWLINAIDRIDSKLKERSFNRHKSEFYDAVKRQSKTWFSVLSAQMIANAIKRKKGEL